MWSLLCAYKRIRTMENSKAVIRKKWSRSLTGGSNCSDFTGEILVFWIGDRLWEAVVYERWSHMELRMYNNN